VRTVLRARRVNSRARRLPGRARTTPTARRPPTVSARRRSSKRWREGGRRRVRFPVAACTPLGARFRRILRRPRLVPPRPRRRAYSSRRPKSSACSIRSVDCIARGAARCGPPLPCRRSAICARDPGGWPSHRLSGRAISMNDGPLGPLILLYPTPGHRGAATTRSHVRCRPQTWRKLPPIGGLQARRIRPYLVAAPLGRPRMSVCYDLRFPQSSYRLARQGAVFPHHSCGLYRADRAGAFARADACPPHRTVIATSSPRRMVYRTRRAQYLRQRPNVAPGAPCLPDEAGEAIGFGQRRDRPRQVAAARRMVPAILMTARFRLRLIMGAPAKGAPCTPPAFHAARRGLGWLALAGTIAKPYGNGMNFAVLGKSRNDLFALRCSPLRNRGVVSRAVRPSNAKRRRKIAALMRRSGREKRDGAAPAALAEIRAAPSPQCKVVARAPLRQRS